MIHLRYFENNVYDDEPINLGKLWAIFLDVPPTDPTDKFKTVWLYRDINFSWYNTISRYILVVVIKGDNKLTLDCARKMGVIMGDNFKDVKSNIDKYYIEKETEKYNL